MSPSPSAEPCGLDAAGRRPALHVAWINQHAAAVGGCEQYLLRTARLLAARGVRNTLLYEVDGAIDRQFAAAFDGAFPLVEPRRQLAAIGADLCYVHRLADDRFIEPLAEGPAPAVRFYHDHALFCLREHKFTTIGRQTCQRTTGLGCYACLGFVNRSDRWPGATVRSLGGLRRLQRRNRGWAGHLVGSQYMAGHLQAHGFDSGRLHTVPLSVGSEHLEDGFPAEQRQPKLIVFAGQLVRGKGVDLLLQALTMLPAAVRLSIAGRGRQQTELQRLAAELQLGDRVAFLGHLGGSELRRLCQRAAVFAMPSRAPETFGLAGLEANSQGAPVVAADVGGIRQWLQPGCNGLLFRSGDAGDLAAALKQVLDSPAAGRQMGEAGRRLCRTEFSPQRHVDRLLDVLLPLAGRQAADGGQPFSRQAGRAETVNQTIEASKIS